MLFAWLPEGRLVGGNRRALQFWPAHPPLAAHDQEELRGRRLVRTHTPARLQMHAADLDAALRYARDASDGHPLAAELRNEVSLFGIETVESHALPLSLFLPTCVVGVCWYQPGGKEPSASIAQGDPQRKPKGNP